MEKSDRPRAAAENYIRDAIKIVQTAQAKRLGHSDMAAVKAVLVGLGIVLRSTFGISVADDAKIAERLRQVAAEMKSCLEPDLSIAHTEVAAAARIFQAMADGLWNGT